MMAGLVRRVLPYGVLAATVCFFNIIRAQDSFDSLLYDKHRFTESVPEKPHFVLFFAPWCGHCKRLMPTWEDLYAKYSNLGEGSPVTIARVDCTQDSALCSSQEVTGYPTMKLFTPKNPDGVKYRGQRDLGSLDSWLREQLAAEGKQVDAKPQVPPPPSKGGAGEAVELTSDNYHETTKSGMHFVKFFAPWCAHCQRLAPTWDELAKSLAYEDKVTVAKVDCTISPEICEAANVKGYPTLLWIKDGKVVDMFNGERTTEMLKAFVDEMKEKYLSIGAGAMRDNLPEEMVMKSMPSPAPTLDSVVVDLTGENFHNAIGSGVSFVKFYAPWCGHCKRLAPTWDELAKKFLAQGNVKICKVDCTLDQNKSLCEEQEVEGYPCLFLFKDGKKVREYNEKRELDSMFHAVMQLLKDEL